MLLCLGIWKGVWINDKRISCARDSWGGWGVSTEFRIQRSWNNGGYDLWIMEHRNDASYIWKPLRVEIEKLDEAQSLPEPTLKIPANLASDLFNSVQKAMSQLYWAKKEDYDVNAMIQKAMQAHIDSLKMVVERTVKCPPGQWRERGLEGGRERMTDREMLLIAYGVLKAIGPQSNDSFTMVIQMIESQLFEQEKTK